MVRIRTQSPEMEKNPPQTSSHFDAVEDFASLKSRETHCFLQHCCQATNSRTSKILIPFNYYDDLLRLWRSMMSVFGLD